MRREKELHKRVGTCFFAGLLLVGLTFLTTDIQQLGYLGFLKIATSGTWGHLFDWPVIWCSLKVMFFSVGLFLCLDALATWAQILQRKEAALTLLLLLVVPVAGFFYGGYCFLRGLL